MFKICVKKVSKDKGVQETNTLDRNKWRGNVRTRYNSWEEKTTQRFELESACRNIVNWNEPMNIVCDGALFSNAWHINHMIDIKMPKQIVIFNSTNSYVSHVTKLGRHYLYVKDIKYFKKGSFTIRANIYKTLNLNILIFWFESLSVGNWS